MRLAKLNEFRRLVYTTDSAPSMHWLRIQIKAGTLPGGLIQCNRYWVDLDEYDRSTGLRCGLVETQREAAKDPLLYGLI